MVTHNWVGNVSCRPTVASRFTLLERAGVYGGRFCPDFSTVFTGVGFENMCANVSYAAGSCVSYPPSPASHLAVGADSRAL